MRSTLRRRKCSSRPRFTLSRSRAASSSPACSTPSTWPATRAPRGRRGVHRHHRAPRPARSCWWRPGACAVRRRARAWRDRSTDGQPRSSTPGTRFSLRRNGQGARTYDAPDTDANRGELGRFVGADGWLWLTGHDLGEAYVMCNGAAERGLGVAVAADQGSAGRRRTPQRAPAASSSRTAGARHEPSALDVRPSAPTVARRRTRAGRSARGAPEGAGWCSERAPRPRGARRRSRRR
jgi:hypothetical protein